MTERLYTANEVATLFGMTRHWVLEHMSRDGAPEPEFEMMRGKVAQPLWTVAGLDRWRGYFAGGKSIPRHRTGDAYSDHKAVNQVGPVTVTWKLWWRCTGDGGVLWWYSTPEGWYVSNNDGQSWDFTGTPIRPSDYRYYSVNTYDTVKGATSAVLRSADRLRQRLERTRALTS